MNAIQKLSQLAEKFQKDKRGQQGLGVTVLIGLGISIFVIVTLFNSLGLNTGLYTTVTATFLPILALGVVAAILIRLFS